MRFSFVSVSFLDVVISSGFPVSQVGPVDDYSTAVEEAAELPMWEAKRPETAGLKLFISSYIFKHE